MIALRWRTDPRAVVVVAGSLSVVQSGQNQAQSEGGVGGEVAFVVSVTDQGLWRARHASGSAWSDLSSAKTSRFPQTELATSSAICGYNDVWARSKARWARLTNRRRRRLDHQPVGAGSCSR